MTKAVELHMVKHCISPILRWSCMLGKSVHCLFGADSITSFFYFIRFVFCFFVTEDPRMMIKKE